MSPVRTSIPRRLAALVLVVVVIVIAFAWFFVSPNLTTQKTGDLVITEGDSAVAIWQRLVAGGFTSRRLPWRYHAWRLNATNDLQAGTYQIQQGETIRSVIKRMVTGDTVPNELTITFPEGFTLQQMAARTAAQNIGTAQQFIAAAQPAAYTDQFPYLANLPPGHDLEGYLFPDTYRVFADDTPADVIQRMLTNFDSKVTTALRAEAAANEYSLHEIITMASIIEREVTSSRDMALVAGVLWQRLADDVGLAADATVHYALDKWDEPLTYQDLAVDSPYNTRRYKGLPPGPISNPGLRAIVAAVRPKQSDYYYYLSSSSGETIFSETLEEHNINKAKHIQ